MREIDSSFDAPAQTLFIVDSSWVHVLTFSGRQSTFPLADLLALILFLALERRPGAWVFLQDSDELLRLHRALEAHLGDFYV